VRPTHVRGNFKIDACTFKHAIGVGQQGRELVRWLEGWDSGLTVERKNARFITLDEAGRTPIETIEMIDCVPLSYSPNQRTSAGTGVASFDFSLQPSDIKLAI
jgi:hypothetical protein